MAPASGRLARLRGLPLTYTPVGATREGLLPEGFDRMRRSRVVGHGRRDFDAAADAVLRWRAQRGAGVRVEASEDPVREGTVGLVRLGPGPLAITAPVRVVFVLDEPTRRGFAYGTLPGHAESGEEAFVVDLRADGAVTFTVTAYSRPAVLLTRLAGPAGRVFQRVMAGRYLAAVRRAVADTHGTG